VLGHRGGNEMWRDRVSLLRHTRQHRCRQSYWRARMHPVGTGETILGRLITQRSAVRIRPRYQESGPQDIVLGATFVVHVASF
jgi:hypothetical protein